MDTVTVRDLRHRGDKVLARVERGESLTVTRDGEPVAAVVPVPCRPVPVRELIARRLNLTRVDAQQLRADVDELLALTAPR